MRATANTMLPLATPLAPLGALTPGTIVQRAFSATPVGTLLLTLLLLASVVRYGMINPARNYQLDFRAFYATGLALHMGVNPYDLDAKQRVIDPLLPGRQHLMGFANPPPTLPLVYLLGTMPLPAAQIVWAWFQLGLLLVGMLLLLRTVGAQFGSPVSLLVAVPYWLSNPVYNLFRWGQIDGLRVALVALAVYLLTRRKTLTAGMSLGLAALVKVYPIAYLWVLLLRREGKALLGAAATIGVLMAVSLAALSPAARLRYLHNNQDEFAQVDWVISPENMSTVGFMHRAFVDNPDGSQPSRAWFDLGSRFALVASIAGNLLLIGATSAWILRRRRELTTAECIAALVPVVLLCELNAWPHHCVPMLIPLAVIVAQAARQPRLTVLDAVWVGAMLFFFALCPIHQFDVELPSRIEHIVGPTTTYAMVLAWLFMLLRYPLLKRRALPVATTPASLAVANAQESAT